MNPAVLDLERRLVDVMEHLSGYQNNFMEIDDLAQVQRDLLGKIRRFAAEEQFLSIGIMGQVKAGKSSFLNALLFDGLHVLPEAATPKTANLTRITYAEQPRLAVEFYTEEEWNAIVQLSGGTDRNHHQANVARELLAMSRQQGLSIADVLRDGQTLNIPAHDLGELKQLLNDYAGNDGRYTAMVKMTELYLPNEELRHLEVVDTPGMNDPVQSRTQKTRDYMSKCDVVFFLSRASQFLDHSDMVLLSEQLPNKGVKRIVLVAGQLDSALLDDGYNRSSLAETEKNLQTRLGRHANSQLEKLIEGKRDHPPEMLNLLRSIRVPIFSSTFAYGYASWPETRWSRTMQHVHQQLQDMAQDQWNSYRFTTEDWQRIGNFAPLKSAFDAARQDRKLLLEQQQLGLLPQMSKQVRDHLQRLAAGVQGRCHQLMKTEMPDVHEQKMSYSRRIADMDQTLRKQIGEVQDNIKKRKHELLESLRADMQGNAEIRTRTGTRTEERSRSVSNAVWYNPFSWFSSSTHYYTETIKYDYISATDAAESIRQFNVQCKLDIERKFNDLVNIRDLNLKLRKSMLDHVDTRSEDFDVAQFKSIIGNSIDRLQIPVLKMPDKDMTSTISRHFQGEITDRQQMEAVREATRRALHDIFNEVLQQVTDAIRVLDQELDTLGRSLASQLSRDIESELQKLQQDLQQKEQQLDEYARLLQWIKNLALFREPAAMTA